MSTSTNGAGAAGSGGGNLFTNALGGVSDFFTGGGNYNYNMSFREKYGFSLVTDNQKRIQAEWDQRAFIKDLRTDKMHSAQLRRNIERTNAITGASVDAATAPDVAAAHAPKSNLHFQAGVPVKV